MKKYIAPILLLLVGLLASRAVLTPGLMQTHDGIWHIERILSMTRELKAGQFPVRWSSVLDNGYGLPVFNFVYPFPYYLASFLNLIGVGVVGSYKLIVLMFYLLGGFGAYLLISRHNKTLALVTSIVYLLSPYVLLDLYIRGAFGELAVIGLAPWLFIAIKDIKEKGIQWYSPLPLFLILISHNFLGLMMLALYFFLVLFVHRSHTKKLLLNMVLSLGLSSFFLLPMLLERNLLLSSPPGLENTDWDRHYVYPSQLLGGAWGYEGSLPWIDASEIPYNLGYANIFMILIFLISIGGSTTIYLILVLASIFLSLNISSFIWDLVPALKIIQFPWRLLAFPVILLPPLVLSLIENRKTKVISNALVVVVIGVLVIIGTSGRLSPQRVLSSQEFAALHAAYEHKFASAYRYEVTPRWAPEERSSGNLIEVKEGSVEIIDVVDKGNSISFVASSLDGGKVAIARNYYPLWHATIDGIPLSLIPTATGEISIALTEGQHFYRVYISNSPIETIGNFVTLISLSIIVIFFIRKYV